MKQHPSQPIVLSRSVCCWHYHSAAVADAGAVVVEDECSVETQPEAAAGTSEG